jgi:hypothetical protein
MAGLRWLLILLLSLGGEIVVAPSGAEALETLEESEEGLHRARGRRVVHPLRAARPAVPVAPSVTAPRRAGARQPSRRPPARPSPKKIPSALADTASSPEDPQFLRA